MDDTPLNNLEPSGDSPVPHAAAEVDVTAVADQMAQRAAELSQQVGPPDAARNSVAADELAAPLEDHVSKVEKIVDQIANELGGATTATPPTPTTSAANSTASSTTELTSTDLTSKAPTPQPSADPVRSSSAPSLQSPPAAQPLTTPSPLSSKLSANEAASAQSTTNATKTPRFSIKPSGSMLLTPLAAMLRALDTPFRRIPSRIKEWVGYAALATSVTAVLVWIYAMLA